MKQGLTLATLVSPPIDFLGKKLGFVVLTRAHELFSFPLSGLIVSAKNLKERPYEIKRVIKAGIKANRYIRQNRTARYRSWRNGRRSIRRWRLRPMIPP